MSHEVSLDSLFEVGSMQVESSRRSDHLAAFDGEQEPGGGSAFFVGVGWQE
jgi:hypothetical protein